VSLEGDAVLELHEVYKSFDHNTLSIEVLRGIDLFVQRGESLAITGASGAGKSTLLNIMGTLESPTQGVVRFEGHDVRDMEEKELCKLRNSDMGFVFQFHHLLPEFNAFENTLMPALIARMSRKEAEGRAESILTRVGLKTRLTHRVGELSGGEQQRVAIARALVMSPKLLLADEPTGNLDMTTGDGIVDLLVNLNRSEGLAMVIVTHNQRLAQRMSRQIELVDGRVRVEKRGSNHVAER
jgi:lipoprotein-releasing system ATP-binding protein